MSVENEEYNGEYQFKTEDLLSTRKEDRKKKREEKKRIRHYKFSDKKHPKEAIASFIIGFFSLGFFISAIVLSVMAKGLGGSEVGLCGFFSLIASVIGIICALVALYKKDVKTGIAWTGLIYNGIVFVVLVCIVLIYM